MAGTKVFWIALGLALAIGAQPSRRRWANAEEYDLASQASVEPDPKHRITLLRDWAARYPKSDFERERLISLALAFQQSGDARESLKRATEALALNANDPSVLLFIAALGPTLPGASESEIATVAACAVRLLSISLSPKPEAGTAPQSEPVIGSTSFVDPETERVLAFIRRLRAARGPVVEKDAELIKRQVAEAALQWAKNIKP
jgi:hypothetical protein